MNRIKRVSLIFRVVFQLLFIVLPILVLLSWVSAPEQLTLLDSTIKLNAIPASYSHPDSILHTLSIAEKSWGFSLDMVLMGINLFILYTLIKLFNLYEQGDIFSMQHVRYIRNIGYALLLGQIWNPVYQFLMGLVLTLHNPPGHRFAAVTLDQTNVGILLTALLVILISWIIAEGCKLREEQQLTI